MKTMLFICVLAAACLTAKAEKNRFQYVVTDNDTLICKKIITGYLNTRCVLLSGEKLVIPNKEINTIGKSALKGKSAFLMEKKPVYLDNKFTGRNALMELIDVEEGLRIYKYEYFNKQVQSWDVIVGLYKGDEFIYSLTNPNVWQIYEYVAQYTCKCTDKELLTSK